MNLFQRVAGMFSGRDAEAPAVRPGRNDACWCGSGKKYKKCHLPEDDRREAARACSLACGPS